MTKPALHDPGGRVRIALPDGVLGEARISACERFRHFMSRDWTPTGGKPRSILWIGMNPSTADAFVSDPTCNRELIFSRDWGYTRYLKGNILDYRATKPADLPKDPVAARSESNLPSILEMASEAELLIAAWGNLHARFQPLVDETLDAILDLGKPLRCLGFNKSGSPKHPLYLRKDAQLTAFPPN